MVQSNRDIEQDISDIIATREALTDKIEWLRCRVTSAEWHTRNQIARPITRVKSILDEARKVMSDQHFRHHLLIMSAMIAFSYLLRQSRRRILRQRVRSRI